VFCDAHAQPARSILLTGKVHTGPHVPSALTNGMPAKIGKCRSVQCLDRDALRTHLAVIQCDPQAGRSNRLPPQNSEHRKQPPGSGRATALRKEQNRS
jgi:hypothetical protein